MIKEKYGDKFVIYGSLDVVDGLLAYEGEALEQYITERFRIYAPGGGFIYNTGHFVQPDIPPQRLIRAYTVVNDLARQYGS
jgi:uroporphyrinogen-III decarboxylase